MDGGEPAELESPADRSNEDHRLGLEHRAGPRLRGGHSRPHIGIMHLDLTDEEAALMASTDDVRP
jgi:hypothetical protein